MRNRFALGVLIAAPLVALVAGGMTPQKPGTLLEALASIRTHRFVNLTHAFAPAFRTGTGSLMRSARPSITTTRASGPRDRDS